MKCQSCGKKEATVKYYENINGNTQKLYFCSECADKLGVSSIGDFSNLFSPIFTTMPEFDLLEKKQCPNCGYTLEDYSNSGILGCQKCYEVFEKNLDEIFYKIHGKNRHIKLSQTNKNVGNKTEKINNNDKNVENKITKLKEELEECISKEEYEQAAIIRDEIKKLK